MQEKLEPQPSGQDSRSASGLRYPSEKGDWMLGQAYKREAANTRMRDNAGQVIFLKGKTAEANSA